MLLVQSKILAGWGTVARKKNFCPDKFPGRRTVAPETVRLSWWFRAVAFSALELRRPGLRSRGKSPANHAENGLKQVRRGLLIPEMPKRTRKRKRRSGSRKVTHPGLSALGARSEEPPISWLMDQALSHPHIISLAAGFTDNPSLPVAEAREVLDELLGDDRLAKSVLQYGGTLGDVSLRRQTADRLRAADEAAGGGRYSSGASKSAYDPDRLLISHGSQQCLYLLTEVLCDPGDIVLVEDPTYFVFLGLAQSHGLRCRGVRMTPEGIDVGHLEEVLAGLERTGELPRLKLLYLVSYNQNPTGITTAIENKSSALRLLGRYERRAGHPIYLLEDAAYRDLRFAGEDVPSALALPGAARRVVYTGTYSKPFATGIRVGFGLMPRRLAPVIARLKGNHDFGTSHLLQRIVSRALETGRFDRHVSELRRRYTGKAAVMGAALEQHCAELLEWRAPQGGLYYWAGLRSRGRSGPRSALFRSALRENVLYVPGALCYADDSSRAKPDNELRLSYGSASEDQIAEGIARLARAIRAVGR